MQCIYKLENGREIWNGLYPYLYLSMYPNIHYYARLGVFLQFPEPNNFLLNQK